MKNTLLVLVALAFHCCSFGQINFEHDYPLAGGPQKNFGITRLDSVSYYYLYLNYPSSQFTLYNLNHSVYKTVTIPVTFTYSSYRIDHITTSLFDCDNTNIEYCLTYFDFTNSIFYVKIFRENGNMLFFGDSLQATYCVGCTNVFNDFIVNTPSGTKMMLRHQDSTIKVYSLCGKLPSLAQELSTGLLNNPYPNPAKKTVRVPYRLPDGEKTAAMKFFDMSGKEIKSFIVDGNFNDILVSIDDLPIGTYACKLFTSQGKSDAVQIIKIE